MFSFDPTFLMAAVSAVLVAGISKGGFGSGASFASVTILALVMPPVQALGLMLPLLMMIDLASLRPYWNRWSGPDARLLILFSVPGIALGAALIRYTDPAALKVLIGVISVGFVIYQMTPRRRSAGARSLPRWAGALAGGVAGFTSFVSHAGGPITAIYLLRQGLNKTRYQATTVIVFFAINLFKLGIYISLGLVAWDTVLAALWLAPVAVLATWLGVRAHVWVPERVYFALTYGLLTITGAKLIWDGLALGQAS